MPVGVLDATVMVMTEFPEPAMDDGLKPTVTPDGCPLADRAIEELKFPEMLVVTVVVPLLP